MNIDYFVLKLTLIELSKILLPALLLYIIMKVKHRRFIKQISKSVYQERLFNETNYDDYIQRI